MGLMLSHLAIGRKSLCNLVVEPGILALALMLGAMANAIIYILIYERRISIVALLGLCFLAAGVFWVVPSLPE
jgi:hypothetical protein